MFLRKRANSKAKAQRTSVARLAVTLFALFTFTFQSFVVQVHVHEASRSASSTLDIGKVSQPGKLPANGDQSDCPICQAMLHAGQFVTPSAVAFGLPSFALFFVIAVASGGQGTQSGSHNWQSRAPPRA